MDIDCRCGHCHGVRRRDDLIKYHQRLFCSVHCLLQVHPKLGVTIGLDHTS